MRLSRIKPFQLCCNMLSCHLILEQFCLKRLIQQNIRQAEILYMNQQFPHKIRNRRQAVKYHTGQPQQGCFHNHGTRRGNCRISSTRVPNTWRVVYYNSQDAMILNSIEVVDMPEVACAAPEDLVDSEQRLREVMAWVNRI